MLKLNPHKRVNAIELLKYSWFNDLQKDIDDSKPKIHKHTIKTCNHNNTSNHISSQKNAIEPLNVNSSFKQQPDNSPNMKRIRRKLCFENYNDEIHNNNINQNIKKRKMSNNIQQYLTPKRRKLNSHKKPNCIDTIMQQHTKQK